MEYEKEILIELNIALKRLILPLLIWEVPGSNLKPETSCPYRKFSGLTQSPRGSALIVCQIRPLPSTSIPVRYLITTPEFDAIESKILRASLNKRYIKIK
jgi:hypothetical protein